MMVKRTTAFFASVFQQLLLFYTLFIIAIAFGFLWKYSLNLHWFGLIIGIIGALGYAVLSQEISKEKNKLGIYVLILLVVGLIFVFQVRALPFVNQPLPLGYDPGLYKYGIEKGLANKDKWILQGGMEPGFLFLMEIIKEFFSSSFILTWLLVGFCVVLGLVVFLTAREYFGVRAALFSLFFYAFSVVQFRAFALSYYKNIIGLSLLLLAFLFLKKAEVRSSYLWLVLVSAALLGAIHRPTFFLFGLTFLVYCFSSAYQSQGFNKKILISNILLGFAIVLFFLLFYIGDFMPAILIMIQPVIESIAAPGQSPGTFINFFTYQFSVLPFLPFAVLGLFVALDKKYSPAKNPLVLLGIITLVIVYFQLFFFNRFIIHLDIALILFTGLGASTLLAQSPHRYYFVLILILVFSAGILAFSTSAREKPLISSSELALIGKINQTSQDSFVMSTSSIYSPWLQGYSSRRVIAPGLFDYDNHTKEEWMMFWNGDDLPYMKEFLQPLQKPLYIFIGQRQKDFLANYPGCFSPYLQEGNSTFYEYKC